MQGDAGDNVDYDNDHDFEVNRDNVLTISSDSADVNQNTKRKRRR